MQVEQHLAEAFGKASPEQFFWQTRHPIVSERERLLVERAFLPLGTKILDVGCGEGATLHHLGAPAGAVGIDLFEAKVEFARSQLPRCRFLRASVYELPFETGSFDQVIVRDLIHHLDEPSRAIDEVRRVLAPGGRLDVLEPIGRNPLVLLHAMVEPSERGELRSTRRYLERLVGRAFTIHASDSLQPLPIHRLVYHRRVGKPELSNNALARKGVEVMEQAAGKLLPEFLWAYLHIRAKR
jgi:SAM-dependent methyltransferase